MEPFLGWLDRTEHAIIGFAAKYATLFLRTALAITYVWFGALKVMGVSPVDELVGKMSSGLQKGFFVRLVGVWELVIGVALLFRLALRLTLVLFFVQLSGDVPRIFI